MTQLPSVSVVIPSVGRSSLRSAVESALKQTVEPVEVIVVLDRPGTELDLPDSQLVSVVETSGGEGAAHARQRGVEAATGEVIALLDDDDVWHDDKLEKQLAAVPAGDHWVLSCRFVARPPGRTPVTMPRYLIRPHEPIADYLITFRSLRFGGASLQTSTLAFPKAVAQAVPLSLSAGSVHDDPLWLMKVRKAFPALTVIQVPDSLVEYGWSAESLSRSAVDRTREYIDWGRTELADTPARVRGDYQLTSPVTAAVSAGSLLGVLLSVIAGVRYGRPGPWAFAYAGLGFARVIAKRGLALVGTVAAKVRR